MGELVMVVLVIAATAFIVSCLWVWFCHIKIMQKKNEQMQMEVSERLKRSLEQLKKNDDDGES